MLDFSKTISREHTSHDHLRVAPLPTDFIGKVPTKDDLVLAVSHAWSHQLHPDPLGISAAQVSSFLGAEKKSV